MADLFERFDVGDRTGAVLSANHRSADLGSLRVTIEQHTEFLRFTFIVDGEGAENFDDVALSRLSAEWLASLPGELLLATHVLLLAAPDAPVDPDEIAARHFSGNELVGARLEGGFETAFTDFRIHEDRFSRLLLLDHAGGALQTGRSLQRLLELDTYRMMALLALPVAQELGPELARCEQQLAEIAEDLRRRDGPGEGEDAAEDDAAILDRLSTLEAELNRHDTQSHTRFSAAAAYHGLVRARVRDLREERIGGLQTFQEFTERRLAPAMQTCDAVSARIAALVDRSGRMMRTLATRVEMTREQQTQAVLRSMDRRVELQLRLQSTVEGLSVVAISYYLVGLVSYAIGGASAAGLPLSKELAVAASVPVVLLVVGFAVRRVRRALGGEH